MLVFLSSHYKCVDLFLLALFFLWLFDHLVKSASFRLLSLALYTTFLNSITCLITDSVSRTFLWALWDRVLSWVRTGDLFSALFTDRTSFLKISVLFPNRTCFLKLLKPFLCPQYYFVLFGFFRPAYEQHFVQLSYRLIVNFLILLEFFVLQVHDTLNYRVKVCILLVKLVQKLRCSLLFLF